MYVRFIQKNRQNMKKTIIVIALVFATLAQSAVAQTSKKTKSYDLNDMPDTLMIMPDPPIPVPATIMAVPKSVMDSLNRKMARWEKKGDPNWIVADMPTFAGITGTTWSEVGLINLIKQTKRQRIADMFHVTKNGGCYLIEVTLKDGIGNFDKKDPYPVDQTEATIWIVNGNVVKFERKMGTASLGEILSKLATTVKPKEFYPHYGQGI